MNNLPERFSACVGAVRAGDNLSAERRRLINEAFAAIRSAAHRHWAARPRGSVLINELRRIILAHPNWSDQVTPLEYKVIAAKFGTKSDLKGELSNTVVGEIVGFSKQTVAHHLKSAHTKLKKAFGAIKAVTGKNHLVSGETDAGETPDSIDGPGLMKDAEWQSLTVWWRRRANRDSMITVQDLGCLQELAVRLSKINVGAPTDGRRSEHRHRRSSPNRFFHLRSALLENKSLLELLTPRQRDVLTVGLALNQKNINERSELGFRGFPAADAMTFQNFNYFVRESLKRMKLDL